jgi:hypothetical protein
MHFKQNCAYKDNEDNYWFVRWVEPLMFESEESRIFTAGLLSFSRPDYLPNDGFAEYTFSGATGEIRLPLHAKCNKGFKLELDNVLDYNINNSLIDIIKNCWKRLTTSPAKFEKFDMVRCVSFKEDGIIITKDELDNEFLIYYPFTGVRQWEHASDLEFVYRPISVVNTNAS